MNTKETRKNIIRAGRKAVDELIKVAEEKMKSVTGGAMPNLNIPGF